MALAVSALGAAADQAVKSDPSRVAAMHEQFRRVMTIHAAVTRGDLEAMRQSARQLAVVELQSGLPDAAARYLRAMRAAADRAAVSEDATSAALATGEMLATCGACHLAMGTRPAPDTDELPVVGGTVGHMLEHQRATNQLVRGLVIPSTSDWMVGARALRASPLHASEVPPNSRLTPELLRVEEAVHRLAEDAVAAETPESRTRVYGTLLARCADCHALHRKIWGPQGRF
jgi:hypothetical protein